MNVKIVYKQSNGQLVSYSYADNLASISPVYDNGTETETTTTLPQAVIDGGDATRYFYVSSSLQKDYYGYFTLTSNRTDSDSDGIEDMPADGTTLATYTLQKKDAAGDDMTDASDNETINISASRGLLSTLSVDLVNGAGTFTLKSVAETVKIQVQATNTTLGTIQKELQLIP